MSAPPGASAPPAGPFDVQECAAQVRAGSRAWIGRAITLVESRRPDHRRLAQQLLLELGTQQNGSTESIRLGVTGVPGVGKSTFIDALGTQLIAAGHRVAVLAVDPSSSRSGGSILGDKTRMVRLASSDDAFVRPSPSAGTLGGVTRATREAMIVVEAAGYDVVIVETVGVGQSEIAVADMVDTFLLLTLARSGDQLQGIKKGVLEFADVIAVNKADGAHAGEARQAARELSGALHLLGGSALGGSAPGGAGAAGDAGGWSAPVLTCSAQEGTGLDEVWAQVLAHRRALAGSGQLQAKRRGQLIGWTRAMVREGLLARLDDSPAVREQAPGLEQQVLSGAITPALAAERILAALGVGLSPEDGLRP